MLACSAGARSAPARGTAPWAAAAACTCARPGRRYNCHFQPLQLAQDDHQTRGQLSHGAQQYQISKVGNHQKALQLECESCACTLGRPVLCRVYCRVTRSQPSQGRWHQSTWEGRQRSPQAAKLWIGQRSRPRISRICPSPERALMRPLLPAPGPRRAPRPRGPAPGRCATRTARHCR